MSADRIFLDANVLFSIVHGSPGLNRLWQLAEEGHCTLFTSDYVIEEVRRNLIHSEQLSKLETFLAKVRIVPEIDPDIPCPIELPDKGRPIMLAALSIKADDLITGDTIHFGKYFGQKVSGVKICRPRDYFAYQKRRD
ncbi:MAG: putative toxin-antitoxin system toxin component, PIN family [Thermodesulfobacteriota bacterium]